MLYEHKMNKPYKKALYENNNSLYKLYLNAYTIFEELEISKAEFLMSLNENHSDLMKEISYKVDSDSVKINLGGIAKGFAADEIVEILKANGVKKAVIDLGGNIYVYGKKSSNLKWTVGAKNPEEPDGDPLILIKTCETSVVSSGTYERYFVKDSIRYHHIFDPETGYPADKNLTQVTVISRKSIIADVLSTTAFVLGKDKTIELQDVFQKEFNTKIDFIFVEKGNTVSWTKNPDIEITTRL